jgi:hypothetical protein
MPRLLGAEAFWDIYRGLDERAGIRPDFLGILGQLAVGRGGVSRALGMAWDRISDTLSVRKTGL